MTNRRKKSGVPLADHSSPFPVSRLAPTIELVDLAREISLADDLLSMQVSGKLKTLAKQMRVLQKEARQLLKETRRNQELHRAQCSFKKVVGQVYHLYQKKEGGLVFSMLSFQNWKGAPPFQYIGSYRLENDMSWVETSRAETFQGEQ